MPVGRIEHSPTDQTYGDSKTQIYRDSKTTISLVQSPLRQLFSNHGALGDVASLLLHLHHCKRHLMT